MFYIVLMILTIIGLLCLYGRLMKSEIVIHRYLLLFSAVDMFSLIYVSSLYHMFKREKELNSPSQI